MRCVWFPTKGSAFIQGCKRQKSTPLPRDAFLSWCSVSDAVAENVPVIEVVVAHKKVACKAFTVEVVAEEAAHFIIVALLYKVAGKALLVLELALVHIAHPFPSEVVVLAAQFHTGIENLAVVVREFDIDTESRFTIISDATRCAVNGRTFRCFPSISACAPVPLAVRRC